MSKWPKKEYDVCPECKISIMNKTDLPVVCNACAKKAQMNIEIFTCDNCGHEDSIDHGKENTKNLIKNADTYTGCSECGYFRIPKEPEHGSKIEYGS